MIKDKLTPTEHAALWDNFRSGSKDAFSQLYKLFAADLYRYGYNLVRNKQLVEDCLHELFLHLHAHRSQLGPTDNIRFYMYRSLRRRLTDSLTKLNKFDSDDYIFDNAEFMIEPYESQVIEEQTLERQKQIVIAELNKLPKRQKEILYLVYMKGFTYQEASEAMDITMKSVYNTINVALTTLKGYLQETFKKQGLLIVLLFFQYFSKN
ncbi:RNA polymerase sigma factor [Emticicia sp.]|uniref:RNA polymerase sigma factor n=1 Tax=Emticicia sp. TaxID=1930953 RepID=UPI003751B764